MKKLLSLLCLSLLLTTACSAKIKVAEEDKTGANSFPSHVTVKELVTAGFNIIRGENAVNNELPAKTTQKQ